MSLTSYLRSWAPTAAILLFCVVLCGFMLTVAGTNSELIAVVCVTLVLGVALAVIVDWLRRHAWYDELSAASCGRYPLWTVEGLHRPSFSEGALAYDVISSISKAANDEAAGHRRAVAEYREYIETWVHEAKSPLAAAHLMVENLVEEAVAHQVDQHVTSRAEVLSDELERVDGFIDQALFYARSETLDRDYLIRAHSLKTLVTDAIKAHARIMIAAGIQPKQHNLDIVVFTDEKWIAFILGQLIQNTVKYARSSGAEIVFSARVLRQGSAQECVELTVADNGCGVPEADVARVFDKGFTGSNGRNSKRATGIGLYLVKRLCDKMGIEVKASSAPQKGFSVVFEFPTNKMHYFE